MKLPINYKESHWAVRKAAREQYSREQKGNCCHCGEPLTEAPRQDIQDAYINLNLFPKTMFNYPVHLHHCHKSHMSIGAVHARCNAYLWQYLGE